MSSAGAGCLLSVILTTSLTPSSPTTDLISSIYQSFRQYCPDLLHCRLIVVFDGFDSVVPEARLKKGYVSTEQAANYNLYKQNVKRLVLNTYRLNVEKMEFFSRESEAEYGSPCQSENVVPFTITQTPDQRVAFIEPARRLGFGLAVRSALRITTTPYVWIQQHDWSLTRPIPLRCLLEVMAASESSPDVPIKYVCFPAIRMLSYAVSAHVTPFPALREATRSLKRIFTPASLPEVTLPLTPMFFWHDKPHIASTAHYLERVFPTRLAMFRGDFIEDKIGQRARTQMKEGMWWKWACWLYYPDDGTEICVRHLQGRVWLGSEATAKKAALSRQRNVSKN